VCPDCSSLIHTELTAAQYKEYEEEARIRYLKAQKVFRKQCLNIILSFTQKMTNQIENFDRPIF